MACTSASCWLPLVALCYALFRGAGRVPLSMVKMALTLIAAVFGTTLLVAPAWCARRTTIRRKRTRPSRRYLSTGNSGTITCVPRQTVT